MADVSGFDPVPMFIGDKALHSADTIRAMIDAATGGESGVTRPRDLKVSAMGSPTNQVQIAAGTATIQNRSTNGSAQAYTLRAPGISRLDIASASGGARSDLIVGRVEDPQFSPWTPYSTDAQKQVGPYVFPRVIPGVGAGITRIDQLGAPYNTQSMVVLARVDMPAGATTVLPGYVKDLRQLTQTRQHRDIELGTPAFEDPMQDALGRMWPNFNPNIPIPKWATSCVIRGDIINVGQRFGPTQGIYTVVLGSLRGPNTGWDLDAPVAGGSRLSLAATAAFDDITGIAGTTVPLHFEGRQYDDPAANPDGYLVTIAQTQVVFDITFYNKPL
jgi:hypothetical protein